MLCLFLISQPLVYLIQVPFYVGGWSIFGYYRWWFGWTILTFPMGFIGYYMKKDRWWGLCVLTPMLALFADRTENIVQRLAYRGAVFVFYALFLPWLTFLR